MKKSKTPRKLIPFTLNEYLYLYGVLKACKPSIKVETVPHRSGGFTSVKTSLESIDNDLKEICNHFKKRFDTKCSIKVDMLGDKRYIFTKLAPKETESFI